MEIIFTVSEIGQESSLLTMADGQKIKIPSNDLPIGTKQGDQLDFMLKQPETEKQLAKDILNEILNTNH